MGWKNGKALELYDVDIRQNGAYRNSQYYVYFPNSKKMWEIPKKGEPFAKHVDMKSFMRPKSLKGMLLKRHGL